MAKEGSIAPKERINITYVPATGNAQEEIELPFKLLVLGDYTNRPDPTIVEDRRPVNIDKDTFNEVMEGMAPSATLSVPDRLSKNPDPDAELGLELSFRSIADFSPERVGRQVPEINKLLELREALVALKGPLGNIPEFRKKIQKLLTDDAAREQLLKELNITLDTDTPDAPKPE
jgi:type VI secretion system protein ImpB